MTEKGFQTFSSRDKQISLERKYNVVVYIQDNGKAYLKIDTSSIFSSNQTVADLIDQGIDQEGWK